MTTVSPRPRRAAKAFRPGRRVTTVGALWPRRLVAVGAGAAEQPSAARVRSLCGAVEVDQLAGGGGVLRGLVVAPPAGEAGEPHREPGVFLDQSPAGAVGRRQGQLGAEDL